MSVRLGRVKAGSRRVVTANVSHKEDLGDVILNAGESPREGPDVGVQR